jgi:hypothetical protein
MMISRRRRRRSGQMESKGVEARQRRATNNNKSQLMSIIFGGESPHSRELILLSAHTWRRRRAHIAQLAPPLERPGHALLFSPPLARPSAKLGPSRGHERARPAEHNAHRAGQLRSPVRL